MDAGDLLQTRLYFLALVLEMRLTHLAYVHTEKSNGFKIFMVLGPVFKYTQVRATAGIRNDPMPVTAEELQ